MAPWRRLSKSKLSLIDENTDASSSKSNLSNPGTPPIGSDLLQSMNSDLQQTIRNKDVKLQDLNEIIEIHQHTIEGLKEEKELLQSQVWTFSDKLTQARNEIESWRQNTGSLDNHLQGLSVQVQATEARNREQMQELASRSNAIQFLSGHNQQLQNQVADLEALVSVSSVETGTNFRSLFSRYSELKREHGEIALKLKSEEEMRLVLDQRLIETQSENDSFKTVINELQKEAASLEICQPQTLRALLTLRLVEQTWSFDPEDQHEEPDQNWLPSGLSESSFDQLCSPAEIQNLATSLPKGASFNQFYQRLRLTVCTACSKAKFSFKIDAHPKFNSLKWLNEYVGKTRYFSCCHEDVCKECFKKHLLDTLETKWWYKLGTIQWFPCPRDGCENALGIRCEADLEICLEQICGIEAEQHMRT